MKREPDDSADSVAQDQIRVFVDRIIRLREEAAGIKGDIREVYAEAKGNGFDKTVLGKIVSYVERRGTDAAKLQEADALFELYLTAYDGVGTRVATHTHEASPKPALRRTDEGSAVPLSPSGNEPASGATKAADPDVVAHTPDVGVDPSQLEETQRQSESEQRRDDGSQSIQSLHIEAAIPAIDADLDGAASLAGTEGEADRQPHSEPEVHTSWLKSTIVPIRKPVTEVAKPDYSKPNPICKDPADCGAYASWKSPCEVCRKAARENGAA